MPTAETPCLGCPFEGHLDFAEAAAVLEGFPRHDPADAALCRLEGAGPDGGRLARAVRRAPVKE